MRKERASESSKYRFKIEYIRKSAPVLIIARRLGGADFSIGENSTLGGCKLLKFLDKPRAIREDGSPDTDAYVFALANEDDSKKLGVGTEVELVP